MIAQQPRRRADVRIEPLPDGSAVLYDPRAQVAYAVSSSAARVWEICDGASTAAAIAEQLAGMYDAPAETITRDVEELLRHLAELELFEPEPGDPR